MKLITKKIIMGCDSRGDGERPYLTRYASPVVFGCAIYLHIFHRSDADVFHDHPWPFVTIPLWRGYREYTMDGINQLKPFRAYYRPATWLHRVQLFRDFRTVPHTEKPAVTLVLRGRFCRTWGFWLGDRWEDFRTYFRRLGC